MIQGMIHSNMMMQGTLRNSLSLYGTIKPETVPKLRKISGLPPLTYTAKEEGTLKNYRIYGNTVSGESVGDKTANMFDGNWLQGYWKFNTGEWNDSSQYIATSIIDCTPNTDYTFSLTGKPINYGFIWYNQAGRRIASNYDHVEEGGSPTHYTATSPASAAFMAVNISREADKTTIVPQDVTDFMLVEGSVSSPYEPYGYKVPMTVEGINILPMSTTPISTDVDDFHCEYDGTGTITLTTDKDNAVLNRFSIPLSEDFIIPVSIGQGGDGCAQFNNSISASLNSDTNHIWVIFYYNSTYIDIWGLTTINRRNSTYSSMGGKTINRVVIDIKGAGFSTNRKMVIRPAFVLNTTEQVPFEPYHAPITTPIYLPEQIRKVGDEAEYIDYGEQKLHRVRKNLLQNTTISRTLSTGITVTVNDNKSVVINGTSSTGSASGIILGGNVVLEKGAYILSGCPQGGSNNTYKLFCIFDDDGERKVLADIGDGATIALNGDNPKVVDNGFYIHALSCDNNVFFPMLRKASIEDDTYEPYIENTDLDVTLPALPTLPGTNVLSVGTVVQPSEVEVTGRIRPVPTGGGE